MPRQQALRPDDGRVVYIEARLDWIHQPSRLERATAERRLNAVENLLAALTRRWRGEMASSSPVTSGSRVGRALRWLSGCSCEGRRRAARARVSVPPPRARWWTKPSPMAGSAFCFGTR
jgi:hypothetical protein